MAGVTLVPGRGGIFEVRVGEKLIFSQKQQGRFPEPREIKEALLRELGLPPATRHD